MRREVFPQTKLSAQTCKHTCHPCVPFIPAAMLFCPVCCNALLTAHHYEGERLECPTVHNYSVLCLACRKIVPILTLSRSSLSFPTLVPICAPPFEKNRAQRACVASQGG
jgi:hypothetical protein